MWKFRRSLLWSCLLHLHIRSLSFAEQDSYFDRNLRKWVLFHIKMFSNRPHLWNVSWYFCLQRSFGSAPHTMPYQTNDHCKRAVFRGGKNDQRARKMTKRAIFRGGKNSLNSHLSLNYTRHTFEMRPVPSLPFFLLFGIMALKWSGARRRGRLYYFPWIAREISSSGSGSRPQTWNHSWNLPLRHAINIQEDLLQIIPYDSIFS